MKKILLIAFFAVLSSFNGFPQTPSSQSDQLLSLYYNVRDALVAGSVTAAASKAAEFQTILKSSDLQLLTDAEKTSLKKDVSAIAGGKNINGQRTAFATLSHSMIALARSKRLSSRPVYQLYCPMKKSAWLSNEQAIKNPYYGAVMLTCGQVQATL